MARRPRVTLAQVVLKIPKVGELLILVEPAAFGAHVDPLVASLRAHRGDALRKGLSEAENAELLTTTDRARAVELIVSGGWGGASTPGPQRHPPPDVIGLSTLARCRDATLR